MPGTVSRRQNIRRSFTPRCNGSGNIGSLPDGRADTELRRLKLPPI
jgi:hypothetical protein